MLYQQNKATIDLQSLRTDTTELKKSFRQLQDLLNDELALKLKHYQKNATLLVKLESRLNNQWNKCMHQIEKFGYCYKVYSNDEIYQNDNAKTLKFSLNLIKKYYINFILKKRLKKMQKFSDYSDYLDENSNIKCLMEHKGIKQSWRKIDKLFARFNEELPDLYIEAPKTIANNQV